MNDDKKLYSRYIAKNSKELLRRGIAPDYEGTKHIEFLYLPLTKIKRRFNGGRPEDFDNKTVEKIARKIQNKEWQPELYEPPMVSIKNGKFELEAGHHRWNGHVEAEEKFLLVSLVEFKDERSREAALLEENTRDNYVKNYASVDNIVSSLTKIVNIDEERGVEITREYITKLIESKGHVKKGSENFGWIYGDLVLKVRLQSTNVKNYNSKEALKTAKVFQRSRNAEFEACFVQRFRDGQSKAQFRLLEKALKIKEDYDDPSWDVVVYGHYSDCKDYAIKRNRPQEKERIKKLQDMIVRWAKIIEDPDYTQPEIRYLPQIEGEAHFDIAKKIELDILLPRPRSEKAGTWH